jgi:hypothetical protein
LVVRFTRTILGSASSALAMLRDKNDDDRCLRSTTSGFAVVRVAVTMRAEAPARW